MSAGWEDRAESFIAWARTPNHDSYWLFRDSFFQLLPPPRRATLEIGCGEGRVCRDLRDRGHTVTGLDAAPTLVAAAVAADAQSTYLVGAAENLPFPDRSFDLVVAYNSLMDVDDMPGAVAEAARVLDRGGRFCICVTHPFRDSGSSRAASTVHPSSSPAPTSKKGRTSSPPNGTGWCSRSRAGRTRSSRTCGHSNRRGCWSRRCESRRGLTTETGGSRSSCTCAG